MLNNSLHRESPTNGQSFEVKQDRLSWGWTKFHQSSDNDALFCCMWCNSWKMSKVFKGPETQPRRRFWLVPDGHLFVDILVCPESEVCDVFLHHQQVSLKRLALRLFTFRYTSVPSKILWKSCLGNCLFLYLLSESLVLIQKYLTPWVLETPWKQHFWLIFPSLYKRDNKDSDCYCSFFVFLWDFHKIVFLLVLSSNRE